MFGVFKDSYTQNVNKIHSSEGTIQKTCPICAGIKHLWNLHKSLVFTTVLFLKISKNGLESFSNIFIEFHLKSLKNEFLVNILLRLDFFHVRPLSLQFFHQHLRKLKNMDRLKTSHPGFFLSPKTLS